MKPEQLVALFVRLFAVALFLHTLRYLPNWMFGTDASLVAAAFIALLMILIAVLLWMFPLTIAKKLLPVTDQNNNPCASESELYGCGFVLIGLYFLFYSTSDGLYWALTLLAAARDPYGSSSISLGDKFLIAITVIEIIASLAVILGSRGLTRLVLKLRYGGVAK